MTEAIFLWYWQYYKCDFVANSRQNHEGRNFQQNKVFFPLTNHQDNYLRCQRLPNCSVTETIFLKISCLARWRRVRRARFWNSDYWASQLAIIYISNYFSENAKLCIYFAESWQFWKPSAQNCLFFQRLRINTDHYFFSSVLNKKFQRSDWLVSTMKGEKIITQPWWCQSWRNLIWIFWRLFCQLDACNQDCLDEM